MCDVQRRSSPSRALSTSTDTGTWMNAHTKTALHRRFPAMLVKSRLVDVLSGHIVTISRARQVKREVVPSLRLPLTTEIPLLRYR